MVVLNLSKIECSTAKPLVTAIIPSFNSESTLEAVIESINKQTKKSFEVLVVYDCSTDNSSKIAVKAGCRLLTLERNSGRGKVRNKGTTESKSRFLLFCDSSNLIDPCFSEKALRHFDKPRVAEALRTQKISSELFKRHQFNFHDQERKSPKAKLLQTNFSSL